MGSGASKKKSKSTPDYGGRQARQPHSMRTGSPRDRRRSGGEHGYQKELNSWASGTQRDRQRTFGGGASPSPPRSRSASDGRYGRRSRSDSPRDRRTRRSKPRSWGSGGSGRSKSPEGWNDKVGNTVKKGYNTTKKATKKEYKRWIRSGDSERRPSPLSDKNNRPRPDKTYSNNAYNKNKVSPSSADTVLMGKDRRKGGANRRGEHRSKQREDKPHRRHRDRSDNKRNRDRDGRAKRHDSKDSDGRRRRSRSTSRDSDASNKRYGRREVEAATKIQAHYRGYKTRKDVDSRGGKDDIKVKKYGVRGRRPPAEQRPSSKLADSATPPTWTKPPEQRPAEQQAMRVAGGSHKKGAPPPGWQLPPGQGNQSKYHSDFVHDYYW